MKFKATVLEPKEIEFDVPQGASVENFIKSSFTDKGLEIKRLEFIEGEKPLKEWYCIWVDDFGFWESEIFEAKSYEDIMFNVRPKIAPHREFLCVLNERAKIEALHRSLWD